MAGPLPDARLPVRSEKTMLVQLKAARMKLLRAQKTISRLKKLNSTLKQDAVLLKCTNNNSAKHVIELSNTDVTDSFLLNQLKLRRMLGTRRRFSEQDRNFSLALYYCSTSAYTFLRKMLCLPTIRSLRRWLANINLSSGFNANIFNMLKLKSKNMSATDRVVSIVVDEMSLKQELVYNASGDFFEGVKDFGTELSSEKKGGKISLANQVLVVMIKGIKSNYKQVIGYFLSEGPVPGPKVKDIILMAITKLQLANFIPKVVVCDQGSNNIQARKLLNITREKPFININGENIYFFYDAPHLLKSMRNNFRKYDISFENKTYRWKYIEEFFEKDRQMKPRLAPKLKEKHISLPPFSPMRVCLAAQVMSHSVSRGILTHVALNSMTSEAAYTAEFLSTMDSLFDCFNSAKLYDAKIYKRAISENSAHWSFLATTEKFLGTMQVQKKGNSALPCTTGWLQNNSALKHLWDDLHNNYEFKFLLTRRLTQDCIENLFSVIRMKGGNNVTPDASKFRATLRIAIVQQLLAPPPQSNCEIDCDTFLLQHKELVKQNSDVFQFPSCSNSVETTSISCTVQEQLSSNSLTYVTGWACSQLPHQECVSKVTRENADLDTDAIHIDMKQYEGSKMLFPNEDIKELARSIHAIVETNLENFIVSSPRGVRTEMEKRIPLPLGPLCHSCSGIFVKKFLNVTISCFTKFFNDRNAQSKIAGKQNKKAKKLLHL